MRRGNWKLYQPHSGPAELYDLAEDPGERADVGLEHGLALPVPVDLVVVVGGPLGGVGEEEVEEAVVVVVEEHRRLRVADVLQAGLLGDVLEGAVAPVVEQDVAPPACW